MTKKQRLLELVRTILTFQKVHDDDFLTVCDCFMAMPDGCIPDGRSLRYFAHESIDHFLGRSDHCEVNYARASKYLAKWRRVWVSNHESRYGPVPVGHPAVFWMCDLDLRVRSMAGSALSELKLHARDFVGRRLVELWGSDDPEHPAVGPFLRALWGECSNTRMRYGGRTFDMVATPIFEDGTITGVTGTGVLLPEEAISKGTRPAVSPGATDRDPVLFRTDRALRIVMAVGSSLKPSPRDFIGADVTELLGPGEAHIIDQFKQAMGGITASRRITLRGHQWQLVTAPRAESPGVLATVALLLTGNRDPSPAEICIKSLPHDRFEGGIS